MTKGEEKVTKSCSGALRHEYEGLSPPLTVSTFQTKSKRWVRIGRAKIYIIGEGESEMSKSTRSRQLWNRPYIFMH